MNKKIIIASSAAIIILCISIVASLYYNKRSGQPAATLATPDNSVNLPKDVEDSLRQAVNLAMPCIDNPHKVPAQTLSEKQHQNVQTRDCLLYELDSQTSKIVPNVAKRAKIDRWRFAFVRDLNTIFYNMAEYNKYRQPTCNMPASLDFKPQSSYIMIKLLDNLLRNQTNIEAYPEKTSLPDTELPEKPADNSSNINEISSYLAATVNKECTEAGFKNADINDLDSLQVASAYKTICFKGAIAATLDQHMSDSPFNKQQETFVLVNQLTDSFYNYCYDLARARKDGENLNGDRINYECDLQLHDIMESIIQEGFKLDLLKNNYPEPNFLY